MLPFISYPHLCEQVAVGFNETQYYMHRRPKHVVGIGFMSKDFFASKIGGALEQLDKYSWDKFDFLTAGWDSKPLEEFEVPGKVQLGEIAYPSYEAKSVTDGWNFNAKAWVECIRAFHEMLPDWKYADTPQIIFMNALWHNDATVTLDIAYHWVLKLENIDVIAEYKKLVDSSKFIQLPYYDPRVNPAAELKKFYENYPSL